MIGAALLGPAQASSAASSPTPATARAAGLATATAVPGPVVLLGTGGLTWSDVENDHLPTLSGLLKDDAVGWLADRSVRALTCPADGWLAVSAGKRAADVEVRPGGPNSPLGCRGLQLPVPAAGSNATVPQWPDYVRQADADNYEAVPGLLGSTLAKAAKTTAAVGPGAAIALADGQGRVANAWPGGAGPLLVGDVQAALATHPNLLVVDLGVLRDPAHPIPSDPADASFSLPKAEQARALDTRLGLVLDQLPANATVIIASIADGRTPSELQLLAARGPAALGGSYAKSLVGSNSTRQDGVAQTTDLLPTVLTALNVPIPVDAVGSALKPVRQGGSAVGRQRKLDDVGQASGVIKPIVPWFFNGLIVAQLLLYGVSTLVLRRGRNTAPGSPQQRLGRRRTLYLLRAGSVVFASVPAASFLANLLPWWRSGSAGLAVTGAVIVFVVPIAALALLGPWRNALLGPLGAVAAVTALVLGGDVTTGSHLTLSSLMGLQPVIAGRFYGFGNPAFAIFVTGALLTAVALADRLVRAGQVRRAGLAIVLVGIAAVIIDGTPGFGSDFGGPPAIIPAFAVLALTVLGVRLSWRRALLIAVITIVVIVGLALLDWARGPADRTHLGRFVQTVIDGGAWPVIQRKAEQNVKILFTSWLTVLLPFGVAFVVFVLARPVALGLRPLQLAYDRSPVLRDGVIAFGVLMLLAAVLNDSGIAIVAVAGTVAIPLLIAASVRALELQDGERPQAVPATAATPTG
jgi:hypothetical protein